MLHNVQQFCKLLLKIIRKDKCTTHLNDAKYNRLNKLSKYYLYEN